MEIILKGLDQYLKFKSERYGREVGCQWSGRARFQSSHYYFIIYLDHTLLCFLAHFHFPSESNYSLKIEFQKRRKLSASVLSVAPLD
jgi:hypothetical protein